MDQGNPALCPTATQDYTGTLALYLNPGNWALCPRDCNQVQVPGNIYKYCSVLNVRNFRFLLQKFSTNVILNMQLLRQQKQI